VTPRAIIAEDEPLLAQQLKSMLARAWPELLVGPIAGNGLEAVELIARERPHVAFLDIRMPGLSGLEAAAEIADGIASGDAAPALVFVTAHDEFALRAFDLAAVDYLLKPVTEERLARCVERLKARIERPPGVESLVSQLQQVLRNESLEKPHSVLRFLRAGVGDTVRMIALDEVCYLQAADKYTSVVTRDGESLIRTPLKEILPQLPPGRFTQVHRSTIVNLAEVASAVRDDAGRIFLKLKSRKESLQVSRLFADQFRQM
jgi:DNA-binding LytR/AlgR family response regulator